jgi:hypothetical protein
MFPKSLHVQFEIPRFVYVQLSDLLSIFYVTKLSIKYLTSVPYITVS